LLCSTTQYFSWRGKNVELKNNEYKVESQIDVDSANPSEKLICPQNISHKYLLVPFVVFEGMFQ